MAPGAAGASVEQNSTAFDARVGRNFTRQTRRGRSVNTASLTELSCESVGCRAIDARGFARLDAVSVENSAMRQFSDEMNTILYISRKMLWPIVSLSRSCAWSSTRPPLLLALGCRPARAQRVHVPLSPDRIRPRSPRLLHDALVGQQRRRRKPHSETSRPMQFLRSTGARALALTPVP